MQCVFRARIRPRVRGAADFQFPRVVEEARPTWREVDWPEYRDLLAVAIRATPSHADSEEWETTYALDDAFETLLTMLPELVEHCVPVAKPSPFSKRWGPAN